MNKPLLNLSWTVIIGMALSVPTRADVSLPHVIGDNMVLQRDKPIKVWGWAAPGEEVSVQGSWQDSGSAATTADAKGAWKTSLPAAKAGGPYTLTVKGENTITLSNVLIGDVWLCSGQSNMAFALKGAEGGEEAAKEADHPEMRLLKVARDYSLTPNADMPSNWEVCSPQSAEDFSAVGFFFGRHLHQELNVPIGLIDSTWGGTQAEAWTPAEELRAEPQLAPILTRWEKNEPRIKQFYVDGMDFDLFFDDVAFIPKSAEAEPKLLDDFDDGDLQNALGGQWDPGWPVADGIASMDVSSPGRGGAGNALHVQGRMQPELDFPVRANCSADGEPVDLSLYKALRFYVRGNGFFHLYSVQPSIWDGDNYSSKVFHASEDWQPVTIQFGRLRQNYWGVQKPFTQNALLSFVIQPVTGMQGHERPPGGLYNGMIAPLVPFGIRGAAWYQGEGNAARAYQYRTLLPALIRGWRKAWGQGDFPFLIVQLAGYKKHKTMPVEDDWAELREAQLMALQLPNTGLAVTIDIGNPLDVHPTNKLDVGRRLALWALGTEYGHAIVYSGPLYDSMKIDKGKVTLMFRHTGTGLVAKGDSRLKGFALAGSDRKFHWANAKIEGDTVIVSSEAVPEPVAVRYGWQGSPDCNLYNAEDLPASPFRTDDWPGITADRK